ncbi:MAG: Holliday junction resolvase RuvX [Anaerosomatales bacterium]
MRVLALDIGERRVGVALSDPGGTIASPLEVLDATGRLEDRVAAIVEEYGVGLIVAGLPLTLGGDEGPQASSVRTVAERIAGRLEVPLVYHDERLSSAQANRAMAGGISSKQRRGTVDKVAAAIFLQSFLDAGGAAEFEPENGSADGP